MIISIHQPQYMPWLGYFDKMAQADIFVLLDDVQYKKNEWQNRNLIKTAQGKQWLTVPAMYHFPEKINEVKINNTEQWQKKQKQSLMVNYSKAPYFKMYFEHMEDIFNTSWHMIRDINVHMVKKLAALLGITTSIVCSSELHIDSTKTERLVDICKKFESNHYIAGKGGEAYMDVSLFNQAGITVTFQEYLHPVYPQLYGEFISHLSVIDLLFNCGEQSLNILKGNA